MSVHQSLVPAGYIAGWGETTCALMIQCHSGERLEAVKTGCNPAICLEQK